MESMPTNGSARERPWVRGICHGVLLLGLALLPPGARAEVSGDTRRYLLSIHRLIEDLEYERALEQVARAKRVSRGPEDDVAVSLYEGVVLAELSKEGQEEAEAAFKSALFLNPDAVLPLSVSPKLRQRFEAVRVKVREELAARGEPSEALKRRAPEPSREALGPGLSTGPVAEVSEGRSSPRQRAWIPAVTGGVLAVGGGVMWWGASGERARLDGPDEDIGSEKDARKVASRTRSLQTVSVGLLVGGAVGLGVATGMYLMGGPGDAMALSVGTDGTSAFVSGRWP